MNIVEATKKADNDHAIRRRAWVSNSMMLIPTDSTFLTSIVFRKDVINVRWEPSKSDLLANDWEICFNPLGTSDPLQSVHLKDN